jgi:hypothetical protein
VVKMILYFSIVSRKLLDEEADESPSPWQIQGLVRFLWSNKIPVTLSVEVTICPTIKYLTRRPAVQLNNTTYVGRQSTHNANKNNGYLRLLCIFLFFYDPSMMRNDLVSQMCRYVTIVIRTNAMVFFRNVVPYAHYIVSRKSTIFLRNINK